MCGSPPHLNARSTRRQRPVVAGSAAPARRRTLRRRRTHPGCDRGWSRWGRLEEAADHETAGRAQAPGCGACWLTSAESTSVAPAKTAKSNTVATCQALLIASRPLPATWTVTSATMTRLAAMTISARAAAASRPRVRTPAQTASVRAGTGCGRARLSPHVSYGRRRAGVKSGRAACDADPPRE